jgi:uncharacterized membrane protein
MGKTMENATKQQDSIWYYKYSTLIGAIVIIICALLMMWAGRIDDSIFALMILGLMSTMMSFFGYIGANSDVRDERTLRISTYAITLSWFCTVMVLGFASIIAYQMEIEYNGIQAIGFALFVGLATMMGWLAYYSTKGDLPENGETG